MRCRPSIWNIICQLSTTRWCCRSFRHARHPYLESLSFADRRDESQKGQHDPPDSHLNNRISDEWSIALAVIIRNNKFKNRRVWDKTKGRCWYCGAALLKPNPDRHTPAQRKKWYTIDHATPRHAHAAAASVKTTCCPVAANVTARRWT